VHALLPRGVVWWDYGKWVSEIDGFAIPVSGDVLMGGLRWDNTGEAWCGIAMHVSEALEEEDSSTLGLLMGDALNCVAKGVV
jgi:hypothetical protein